MVGTQIKFWRVFRLRGQSMKRPDGRKCWASSKVTVLQVVDGSRNAGAAECRHRRPEHSSLRGMAVCICSDTSELSLPAWNTPGQKRQVSRLAVSDPGRGQTSKCRCRHAQQRSIHAVTCPLLFLVHQQEQCCSNQSVNLQWRRQV